MQKHTKRYMGSFLKKSFYGFGANSTYKPKAFRNMLTTAAFGNDFIETASSVLNGVNADTLFRRIEHFSRIDDIEKAFNSMLEKILKRINVFSRNHSYSVAIDITYEPYYGKKQNFWIHPYSPVRGSSGSFYFLEMSIVQGDKRFMLYAMPVHLGWDKAKTITKLLNIASKYLKIREVLLDRGFYSAAVIDAVRKFKYVILVPQNRLVKCMIESVQDYAVVEHELVLNKDFSKKKVQTNLVLIKGKDFDWCFATNSFLGGAERYIQHYKRRWGIETTNRCLDEVHVKTKSTNIIVKTFLFLFSCLLYNLWIWLKLEGFAITLRQLAYSLFLNTFGITYVKPS